MSKYVKGLIQGEMGKMITDAQISDFMVVSTRGISGNENNELRGEMLKKGMRLSVVKNALFKKALANTGMESGVELIEGTCAIAYGGDSIVDVAKEVVDWSKKFKAFEVKGAYLEGIAYDAAGALTVSKMLTRVELLGEVAMLANSPASNLVGAIGGPAGVIAGCIKTIIDKGEDSESQAA